MSLKYQVALFLKIVVEFGGSETVYATESDGTINVSIIVTGNLPSAVDCQVWTTDGTAQGTITCTYNIRRYMYMYMYMCITSFLFR